MKQRFNALDLKAALFELRNNFIGLRVSNVYDIDNKTYLIKLAKPDDKAVILIESGIRIHGTSYEWPKNVIPSGFSMKMRKHLKSRRLEKITQLGVDRIIDMQFGSGEAAYHLIVELYDKGNILLTDYEYVILNLLRPRTDADSDVRFAVREKYPLHTAKQEEQVNLERLKELLTNAKDNDLKKVLTSQLLYATPLVEHCLTIAGFPDKCQIGKNFNIETDLDKLLQVLLDADSILKKADSELSKGYIIQKKTKAAKLETAPELSQNEEILTYEEFHPFLFKKHELSSCFIEYESFDKAVDEFFSKIESQKLELKTVQQNKEAIKKLENVKKDHEKRIEDLQRSQAKDEINAKLIENNLELVDRAIYLINNAIANQLDWNDINEIVEDAKDQGHPVASIIKHLKLDTNHITILLKNTENEENQDEIVQLEIDLGLNAFKNAKKYYDHKKYSVAKEQKTIESSDKALKNAEKRTLETLKQAKRTVMITKSRKLYWFEKFYWFISSENYLVIGGRDQQQNELIVKRHLKTGDLYVHADLHGASSVVIKNPSGNPVAPKTINEAGCMAVCYSGAWEAKITTSAYWVYNNQVSKQAPTGEYLSTGSFMIRGKKNYIPQTTLICGFALIYKLEEGSIARHLNERRVKTTEEDEESNVKEEEEGDDQVNQEIDNMIQELEKAQVNENVDEENEENVENQAQADVEKEDLIENKSQQNEENDDDDDGESETENYYPETNFRFQILKDENQEKNEKKEEDEEALDAKPELNQQKSSTSKPYISRKQRRDLKKSKKDDGQKKQVSEYNKTDSESDTDKNKNEQQQKNKVIVKRGQRSKLAKIKQKYKDQDEEDRELIMQYLAPAGKKESKKEESKKQQQQQQKSQQNKKQEKPKKIIENLSTTTVPLTLEKNEEQDVENQIEDNEDDETSKDELNVIDSLTGVPVVEDELLFCIPMCAPYTAIQNYKHKVKITPGTTKKGQAVKTATEIFLRDKETSQHEKDLIKALKDQDLSKNLPGKVKVSAPNLMKIKKKK